MAMYAKIVNNVVKTVILADREFINKIRNYDLWVECFSDIENNPRGVCAAPNFTYNPETDKFYPQKPFESWVWNEQIWDWEAPIPMPEDDMDCDGDICRCHYWDEESLSWAKIQREVSENWQLD